jgi:hypothetical protein
MIRAAGYAIGFTAAAIVLLVLALAALVVHGIAWATGHRSPAPPARPGLRDWQPPAGDLATFYCSGAADRHPV